MNMPFKLKMSAFLMGFLLIAPHQPLNAWDFKDITARHVVIGTAAVAVTAILGFGLYKLIDALSMTDEELIADSKKLYETSRQDVASMLAILSSASPNDPTSILEPLLYELANECLTRPNITYEKFISSINHTEARLTDRISTLSKRLAKLKKDHISYVMIEQMEEMIHYLGLLHAQWLTVQTFINRHTCYFALFSCEAELLKQFNQEINYYTNYQHDPRALAQLLKGLVNQDPRVYPYLHYVEKLTTARNRLKKVLDQCYSYYPHRISAANSLLQVLEWIRGVISSEEIYLNELQKREYERAQQAVINQIQLNAEIAHQQYLQAQQINQPDVAPRERRRAPQKMNQQNMQQHHVPAQVPLPQRN
jgi:hypothetical protein